jgi:hypothetical protein
MLGAAVGDLRSKPNHAKFHDFCSGAIHCAKKHHDLKIAPTKSKAITK